MYKIQTTDMNTSILSNSLLLLQQLSINHNNLPFSFPAPQRSSYRLIESFIGHKIMRHDDGTEAPGLSCYARSKKVNPVRYDVGANGYCVHHNCIQILRQTENGTWATVRKKCPECIKEGCPVMLGGDGSTPNEAMVEHEEPRSLSESTLSSSAISTPDLIENADNNGLEILLRRPDRISVSCWSPSKKRDEQIAIDYRSAMLEGLQFC